MSAVVVVGLLTAWIANFRPFDDLVDRAGTPLGADYGVFYLPGRMVLEGRPQDLYSHEAQQRALHELFPTLDPGDWLPFRYPPWVAAAMAPLAALPYVASFVLFTTLSLGALLVAWRMLVRRLTWLDPTWRTTMLFALLGWPIVWETLLGGQSSLFSLAILCTTAALADTRRFTAAGAVLAFAVFKPNALMWFGLGYVLRYPRLLRGAIPIGLALAAISVATVGWQGMLDYVQLGTRLAAGGWDFETDAAKVQGLAMWLAPLVPGYDRPLLLGIGFISTIGIAAIWRRHDGDRRYDAAATALLICINTLCNPYVPIYDLALLAAGFAFLIETERLGGGNLEGRNVVRLQFIAGLFYFGPHMSQAVCVRWGVQPFPLLLVLLTAGLARRWISTTSPADRASPAAGSLEPSRSADRAPRPVPEIGSLRLNDPAGPTPFPS